MNKDAQVSLLIHARTMEYRILKLLEQKDLPPLVRIHAQGTKVSIENLVHAIQEGR